jgi:IclR family transcriptional regulator, KDG regulon repressor
MMYSKIQVPAACRVLRTLEAISHQHRGFTNADLTRRLNVPRSSMSYLLRVLEENGYVRRDHLTGRYKLGYRLLTLAQDVISTSDLREVAMPFMNDLTLNTGLTSVLSVPEDHEAVVLESVIGQKYFKVERSRGVAKLGRVGQRLPLHATSMGKVLLAWHPNAELELSRLALRKYTPNTITNVNALRAELQSVRERGCALNYEEHLPGYWGASAPIFCGDKLLAAALTATVITQETDFQLDEIMLMVKRKADQISSALGSAPFIT